MYLLCGQTGECANNETIPDGDLPSRRAVHGNFAGAMLGSNDVGCNALSAVRIVNLNLLELSNTGELQQISIHGECAFRLWVSVRDTGLMQLRFEHRYVHKAFSDVKDFAVNE
jgi:hypothetical protein